MVVCFTLIVSIFFTNTPATVLMLQSMVMHKIPVPFPCRAHVTCLGPWPLDSWQNSTQFWPLRLVCSSKGLKVTQACVNHIFDLCRTHVKCLRPCPLDSLQNSNPIWPLTLVCSSLGSRVSNGHVSTCGRHMLCVWNHVQWISGEILPHFDPRHSPVAHLEAELVMDTCRHVADTCYVSGTMSIEFLAKFYPILTPHTPL